MRPVVEHDASGGGEEPDGDGQGPAFSPQEVALFALRSARQNLWFCLVITLTIAALGSTVVSALPPTYEVTSKVFLQEGGSVTSSLASGRERSRVDGKRGLQELILARDNLISIVREAQLIESWPRTRPLAMRIKDRVFAALFGPPARKDLERGFVEMLATSISGEEDGDSVRFKSKWRDAQNAYDVARLVQRNFLAARAANDLGPIQRAIPFLEAQQQQADRAIASAVNMVVQQTAKAHPGTPPTPSMDEEKPASDPNATSVLELAALSRELSDTRREARSLVESMRKRLTTLKEEMVELNTNYAPEHPLVRQQQARIEAASVQPAELAQLKAKEAELISKLSSRGVSRAATAVATEEQQPASVEETELAPVKMRLGAALRKSDDIAERLEAARIELATAEADFKHRYLVVEPPEMPSKPVSRKQPLFFALVFVAAALIGFLSGAARELMKGRIVEPWQVRALGLELLAEVDLKKLPPTGKT